MGIGANECFCKFQLSCSCRVQRTMILCSLVATEFVVRLWSDSKWNACCLLLESQGSFVALLGLVFYVEVIFFALYFRTTFVNTGLRWSSLMAQ